MLLVSYSSEFRLREVDRACTIEGLISSHVHLRPNDQQSILTGSKTHLQTI
jgi:hypothetical protein